ncbi:MAG: hypothetical protein M1838_000239 [Thelocarpon superellum]|nr:MAG: hypothetical protein M1838_000239 [Thelocarpon superellum]
MRVGVALLLLVGLASSASLKKKRAQGGGYVLPSSGTASTTQFNIGSEFAHGTSCGATALPDGGGAGGSPGGGSGYLYAAINQLGFGANPSANAGGPGGACGQCFQISPVDDSTQTTLCNQSLIFKIVDECPISQGSHCAQCSTSDVNSNGHAFHFDIAADAMNQQQYQQFYQSVTDGSNWNNVRFQNVACGGSGNDDPKITSWGCLSNCQNNNQQPNC